MKIAIVGTGGVGGYFGGRLAQAGNDVHFLARGTHLQAMRETGLHIESPLGNTTIKPIKLVDDADTIGTTDVVLIAVKLWDTEAAAQSLKPLVGPDTAVISLQNGVDKDAILERFVSKSNIVGGLCYIAASIRAPGVIEHAGQMARIVLGELHGGASARSAAFLAALYAAQVTAELSPDIRRAIWEKFVFLVGLSTTTALTRLPVGPIRSDPDTRALLFEIMQETVSVGIAKGIAMDPEFAMDRLKFCDTIPATMMSSMQIDLARGTRLELDWLNGAVVRFGRELGIPTPVNRVAHAALKLHAAGRGMDGPV